MNKDLKKDYKKCADCGIVKKRSEYSLRHNGVGVYIFPYCKNCMVKRSAAWIDKNRDRFNKYQRKYLKEKRNKNATRTA